MSVPLTSESMLCPKMISGLKSNNCEERLRELNLPTVLERRHQADMVMDMDIVHKLDTPREGWAGPQYLVQES